MFVKLLRNSRGQAMAEMAIVLPILILLLMGMVDLGRIFHSYLVITNASREGARKAVLGCTDIIIRERVSDTTTHLDNTVLNTSISPDPSLRKSGDLVTVQVNYRVTLMAPLINTVLPNPIAIQADTTMRME
jgi:Flp pilus assembly protein TadG